MRAYFSVKPDGIQGLFQPFHFFYAIGASQAEHYMFAVRHLRPDMVCLQELFHLISVFCAKSEASGV